VRELRPGLWHWEAPHPEWSAGEPWNPVVSSYAIDDGERLLLFDPMPPPSAIDTLMADRETVVVLTCPWHERATERLVQRLDLPVYTPLPDTAEDLMRTYGVTAEQAADGSPDLVWLLKERKGDARPYAAGDRLAVGVEAFPGQKPNDMVLWIESHAALIAGDTLVDFGHGLEINPRWLGPTLTREDVVGPLRPLLDLPVEHALATHGGRFGRAALGHALSPGGVPWAAVVSWRP
jgi:glyoxylase-like metal-dependent hydrolase (beta-lactamase superfamily II)